MFIFQNPKNKEIATFNNLSEVGMGFIDWINITDTDQAKIYLLEKSKSQKINELNEFHNSDETRELTVKSGNRQTHINMKNDRALIDEQISNMECSFELFLIPRNVKSFFCSTLSLQK